MSGLMRSNIGLGLVQAGGPMSFYPDRDPAEFRSVVRKAVKIGVRSFDSAYTYPEADAILASVLKERHIQREEYDITGKVMCVPSFRRKAETCLKRLGSEYLDTLLIHWPTHDGKLLFSVLKELEGLKKEGKCLKTGVSNFPSSLLAEVSSDFEINVTERPFSLLWTKGHRETAAISRQNNISMYCYGPLGFGLLSGNYETRDSLTDDRRLLWVFDHEREYHALLEEIRKISTDHECTTCEVALAFASSWGYEKVFAGARTESQLDIFTRSVTLDEEELSRLYRRADELSALSDSDNMYGHRW